MKKYALIPLAVVYLIVALGCIATRTQIQRPSEKATKIEFKVMKELEKFRGKINTGIRITAGGFFDATGQFKDVVRNRYSKAVTQGGEWLLYHMLYKAFGPRLVVDRNTDTFQRLINEYGYQDRGHIRRGVPRGGLFGAHYLVTGAVVFFDEDRYSGGGGINIDGLGAHFEKAVSRVGIELRLVDTSTSEICWSTMVESWVSGTLIGMDLFRFVTAWGDEYYVNAEAGAAEYLPTDHALQICIASALLDMIEENGHIFSAKAAAKSRRAKQQAAEQKKSEQRAGEPGQAKAEEKGIKESTPFWKQPSYRSPTPGS